MQPWWAVGVAVPALAARGVLVARSNRKARAEQQQEEASNEAAGGSGFVCERVCTSQRLQKRMGDLAKDATPNSCVTVCGVSSNDACIEACQRAVCSQVNHQVPDWNDQCLKRCTTECLKGRTV